MSRMLASVRNEQEARQALAAGVHIIDGKEPACGALGALPADTLRAIVREVDGRVPVSATVGDLPAVPEILLPAIRDTLQCGVDLVKIGFFGFSGLRDCLHTLCPLARRHPLVAVFFADLQTPQEEQLDLLKACGFAGVMLDTAGKQGASLSGCLSSEALQRFVTGSRERGLFTGLAGRLQLSDIPRLLPLQADYLGFRSALTQGVRHSALSELALRRVRAALPEEAAVTRFVGA